MMVGDQNGEQMSVETIFLDLLVSDLRTPENCSQANRESHDCFSQAENKVGQFDFNPEESRWRP